MEKNKTGKYFKYAIGEIVLVVIGILIALQVNNWNEGRLLSQRRVELLENIKADYITNIARLEMAKKESSETNKSIFHFMEVLSSKAESIPIDTLQKYSSRFITVTRFSPLNSSYLTAESTGDIGLVTDKKLLELFIEFQEAQEWLNFHVRLSGDMVYSGNVWEMRKELGSLNVIYSDATDPFPKSFKKSYDGYQKFFRDKSTYATIESMYWINRNILRSINAMLEVNEKILSKIDEVLSQ